MEPANPSSGNVFSDNLYERLGITPYATPGEIEQQWRKRLRELHPDAGGSSEAAARLNEAKNILSNTKLRSIYDKEGLDGVARFVKQARKSPAAPASTQAIINIPPTQPESQPTPAAPHRARLLPLVAAVALVALIAGGAGVGIAWYIFLAPNYRPVAVKPATPPQPAPGQRTAQNPTPPPAGAPGNLIITKARWGYGTGTVDVAPILNQIIKDGRLAFEATPAVLGKDPVPGYASQLSINYTLNGRLGSGTYRTGTTVTIPAGSPGDIVKAYDPAHPPSQTVVPASDLAIVDATWGNAGKRISVTDVLRAQVKDGRLDVTVNNTLLTDPTPSIEKYLAITYDYQGRRTTVAVNEGQKLTIGAAAGTPTISPMASTVKPPAKAPPAAAPAPARPRPAAAPAPAPAAPVDPQVIWDEKIAAARLSHPTGLLVLQARYGVENGNGVDVTDLCQSMVSGDSLTLTCTPEGYNKPEIWQGRFSITYYDGTKVITKPGGDPILQIGPRTTSFVRTGKGMQNLDQTIAEFRKTHPNDLVVLNARYGVDKGNGVDLTDLCQQMVSGDSLTITCSPEGFNQPAIWQGRFFVTYFDGKNVITKPGGDPILQIGPKTTSYVRLGKGMQNLDQTVTEFRKTHPKDLLVLEARYGVDKGNGVDLTDLCQQMVSGDSLTITCSPEGFNQPEIWQASFSVTYFDGTNVITKRAGDPVLQIGPRTTSFVRAGKGMQNMDLAVAEKRKSNPTGLLVLDARYGSVKNHVDVTDICQSLVQGDSLTVSTAPKALNHEPIWEAAFDITYTDGKVTKSIHASENDVVQVGPAVTSFYRFGAGAITVNQAVANQRAKFGDGLLVLNATYGGERQALVDVTDLLQSRIAAGKLLTKVGGTGWPDPAFGQAKHIDLVYWDGTTAKSFSGKEGDLISLAATLPDGLRNLQSMPTFVAAGNPLTHNFSAPGTYTLTAAPKGAVISPTGRLTWTPADDQVGTQELKFSIAINGKNYIQSQKTEVVSSATAAAVGGDLKKLQSFMRLDLTADDHSYQPSFDRKDALVLAKDQLLVLDADGITVKSTLKLARPYIRIAERDTYFVAIRNDPLAMDLLDKKTGKPTKTIKLDYNNFHDLALLPNKPISFVTASIAPTVPHDRIVVINEDSGDVREPKDLMGTFMQIDHSGQHMWVGLKDIYRTGTEYHVDPNLNVYDIPTYGDIDYLLRYDLVNGALVLKEHLDSAGANGSGIQLSPDGKRVTYLSFTGFPLYSKNIAAWAGLDFEKKPVVYNIKDATGGQGSQHLEFHPVLPIVLIAKEDGVLIFGRDSGDEEPNHIKIAPGALAGISVRNAHFSPDGLSVILDCQQGEKCFLYKLPLLATDAEKALIKKGLPPIPAEKPAPPEATPIAPGVERG